MRIAFVFPGQGSQSVGMLSGFADNETVAGVMARADEALGFSLTGLIAEGPAETLSLTVNTQPAMLASSVAFYEAWLAAGGRTPSSVLPTTTSRPPSPRPARRAASRPSTSTRPVRS